jgi:SAM-dependent methyltransferase
MSSVVDQLRGTYESVQYRSLPIATSRPDNLHLIATLAGVPATPVIACRVLEIGCGTGGNITAMAEALPGSRFLGIDLSPSQIQAGVALVQRAGIKNIELRCQNLMEFSDEGPFDYIIAHGFYSWVPKEVRDQALEVCRRSLSPMGLAYFSYNTLPGWHLKRIARDMMLFHSNRTSTPKERAVLAREMIGLAASLPEGRPTYLGVLKELARHVSESEDWFLLHDDLELINEPVHFTDFVRHAGEHQLKYVAAASPAMELFRWLPPSFQAKLRQFTQNPVEIEQYLDFLYGPAYRASVLCRENVIPSPKVGAKSLEGLFVAGRLVEEPATATGAVTFAEARTARQKKIAITDPASISAFRRIKNAWPHAVAFSELLSSSDPSLASTLADQILKAYSVAILELWTRPTDFIDAEAKTPRATALARLQAEAGGPVINLRHESIIADEVVKNILPLLDGTRDRSGVRKELTRLVDSGKVNLKSKTGAGQATRTDLYAAVDECLRNFVNSSLLAV